jgi:hypothetical protein
MGGDFVLLFGKQSEPAVIIVCSSVFGSIWLIDHMFMVV